MQAQLLTLIKAVFKHTAVFVTISLSIGMTSSATYAITIDFDDIAVIPIDGCFCDHPLADEYLAQGLQIDGGYLVGESMPDGTNENQLLGSNFLQLRFIGSLPTYVSMYVSAVLEQAVYLYAYSSDGLVSQHQTARWAGTEENSTPYVPNQYVSFESSAGISSITIEAFYGLRVGPIIDDLTYEYTSVPEPSSLTLFGLGLLGFVWRRSIARRTISGEHGRT